MNGKHSQKKSKKPLIICAAAVIVVAVICIIIVFTINNNGKTNVASSQNSSTQTVSVVETTAYVQNTTTENSTDSSNASSVENNTSTSQKVVVPESSSENSEYFSKTFTPYKATDSESGNSCSLKEVFGSSYTSGNIKFNSDGTFTDNMTTSSVNSGAYVLNDKKITATYTNDKNMSVTVVSTEGNIPSEISVNYGGYDVYFK